jgi:hypothetical protein
MTQLTIEKKPVINSVYAFDTILSRVKMYLMENTFPGQILLEYGQWGLSDVWMKNFITDMQIYEKCMKSNYHHFHPQYAQSPSKAVKKQFDYQVLINDAEKRFRTETLSTQVSLQNKLGKIELLLTLVQRKDRLPSWEWIDKNKIDISPENWFALCMAFPQKSQILLPEIMARQNNPCYLQENLFLFNALCKIITDNHKGNKTYFQKLEELRKTYKKVMLYETLSMENKDESESLNKTHHSIMKI